MKKVLQVSVFLMAVFLMAFLTACTEIPAANTEGSTCSQQQIDEMIGKLEMAKATAADARDEALAVLAEDFAAKQDASAELQQLTEAVEATYEARCAALSEMIQTLENASVSDLTAEQLAQAEALIAQKDHDFGKTIEHSRNADCSSCTDKDVYRICTKCNALHWGKMEHSLELCYDMSMHWNRCLQCDTAMPRWKHEAGVDGQCTQCPCVVNANILILEKFAGESETLCGMIDSRHTVKVLNVDNAPASVEDLARYDEVILVNVAYRDMPAGFEELLHTYVSEYGGGLLTVGGQNDMVNGQPVPHAYNREDMAASTYYKEMLPVEVCNFTEPVAVMLVIDRSASATDWTLIPGPMEDPSDGTDMRDVIQDAAMGILDTLSDDDYCGVIDMQFAAEVKSPLIPASQKYDLMHSICDPEMENDCGGTILTKAVILAGDQLAEVENVASKHIIVLTDGMFGDSYADYSPYIEENVSRGITMSIVTVNMYDEKIQAQLEKTVELSGGKYYNIDIEEIKQAAVLMGREFAVDSAPQIRYGQQFELEIGEANSAVEGLQSAQLLDLTGYYLTKMKDGAIAPLVSDWIPIYAQWEYGEGMVCSFMCDLGGEWSEAFAASETGISILDAILMILANETEENAGS